VVETFAKRFYNCNGTYSNGSIPGDAGLTTKPKLLVISEGQTDADLFSATVSREYELVVVKNPLRAAVMLMQNNNEFAGVYLSAENAQHRLKLASIFEKDRILDGMPDGVAVLDENNTILWANQCLQRWAKRGNIVAENFYCALRTHDILGPDYCPLHSARQAAEGRASIIKAADNKYYHLHAAPILDSPGEARHIIVTVRDVTLETLQQQKLEAIHKAGIELANLTAEEVFKMTVEERVGLLKSKILHFTKDLLNFDVVEIRLLEKSGQLMPLLAEGLDQDAQERILYALPEGNGVTGFVASSAKSYLCEDTSTDPLFLEGFKGSKSSLTVPLVLNEQVIGTFNVESPKIKAFIEADLQFLEIFSRDIAVALNTLELLVAQKATAVKAGVEAIHSAVALPVDQILNEAVHVMERYIGHDQELVQRVQKILRNARDIKQVIQKIGREMAPAEAVPLGAQVADRPKLMGKRILVVDADENVLCAAHTLLERYGCIIETATNGEQAVIMMRNSLRYVPYDIVITDIRLPDMGGHNLMQLLLKMIDPVPLILMTGFGYDPGHAIVKAREAGLHPQAILYKPFRLDLLLKVIETVLDHHLSLA
jgi:two-component system, sensor histidine kinase SagS